MHACISCIPCTSFQHIFKGSKQPNCKHFRIIDYGRRSSSVQTQGNWRSSYPQIADPTGFLTRYGRISSLLSVKMEDVLMNTLVRFCNTILTRQQLGYPMTDKPNILLLVGLFLRDSQENPEVQRTASCLQRQFRQSPLDIGFIFLCTWTDGFLYFVLLPSTYKRKFLHIKYLQSDL